MLIFKIVCIFQFCLILLVALKLRTWFLTKKKEREKERERNHFTKLADFSKNFKQPQIYVVVDKM